MGVEPFLIASSIIGIVAQRLVRINCDKCKEEYIPESVVLRDLGLEPSAKCYRGKGCPNCNQTGFLGRVGVFELLVVDDQIRKMINEKASADQIRGRAVQSGMELLRDDGIKKVQWGFTTAEEVLRVTKTE